MTSFRTLFGLPTSTAARLRPADRTAESLEERVLLTAYAVDSYGDGSLADLARADGELTFREAAEAARTNQAFGDAAAGSATGFDTITLLDDDIFIEDRHGSILLGGKLIITGQKSGDQKLSSISSDGETNLLIGLSGADLVFEDFAMTGANRAVDLRGTAKGTFSGMTFSENSTPETEGGAAIRVADGDLLVKDSVFDANTADDDGGAILVTGSETGQVIQIRNSTFDVNYAGDDGGAVHSSAWKFTSIDNVFTGNSSEDQGGAVWLSGTTGFFRDTRIGGTQTADTNEATEGGGVAVTGGMTATFSTGVVIQKNKARGTFNQGGGLFVGQDSRAQVLAGAELKENSAEGNGGGAALEGGRLDVRSGASVVDNLAGVASPGGSGGGIYARGYLGTNAYVRLLDTSLKGNKAHNDGGALYLWGANANIGGTVFGGTAASDGNVAAAPLSGSGAGNGGAIFAFSSGTTIQATDTTFQNNDGGSNGGAVLLQDNVVALFLGGSEFKDNQADFRGGAIHGVFDAKITARVTSFSDNTAATAGGAVSLQNSSRFTGIGVTMTGNTANAGGAIHASGGTPVLFLGNSTLSGNTADNSFAGDGNGGAVFVADGSATLDNTDLLNNTAVVDGGGLAAEDAVAVIIRNGSLIKDNTAGRDGGGLWTSGGSGSAANGVLRLQSSVVESNTATRHGGGIAMSGAGAGRVAVEDNAEVKTNTAENGGGVYMEDDRKLLVTALGSITANNATATTGTVGGGVRNAGTGVLENLGTISGNSPADIA